MTVQLQISSVLYEQIVKSAETASVSVEEFLLLAAAEKVASVDHHKWLTHGRDAEPLDPCAE